MNLIHNMMMCSEITLLELPPHLPGVIELRILFPQNSHVILQTKSLEELKDLQRDPWVGVMNTVRWEILFKTICSKKSFWEYVLINVVSTAPADGMALIGWIFVTSFT